jgi:hypothetical protein
LKGGNFNAEGLLGGELPILVLNFPVEQPKYRDSNATAHVQSTTLFWEMSVVPVATGTGFEQPVFIRYLQVNRSVATSGGTERPGVLYFDTFAYIPSKCAATGEGVIKPEDPSGILDTLAGCDPPGSFECEFEFYQFGFGIKYRKWHSVPPLD